VNVTHRPRYAYIERLAERILGEAGVAAAPVPVEEIARSNGCRVVRSDLKEISGILVRSEGVPVIGVNAKHPETRRRFTVAHELGHLLLHEGKEVRFDKDFRVSLRSSTSSTGTDIEEIEANFFAASLLMPTKFTEADPRAAFIELENVKAVEALAATYKVSPQAMTLRLARFMGRRAG
jgi:Zn-dependent peptidase ImmA (M78 family)